MPVARAGSSSQCARRARARREVSAAEGEAKAREAGVLFMETSAKAGLNIKQLFRRLATALPGDAQPAGAARPEGATVNLRLDKGAGAAEGGGCSC
mmetsp:Transcript_6772/g.23127  ORF Transcript_6772/g.23127 Transcript_6772/m.23127 type:complete len:96 (+) Transcript_6772:482-769(+)